MTAPVVAAPGIYDMDEATYHNDPVPGGSLSCSGAKLLLPPSCPAIYRWVRSQPRNPTPAMEFGTAAHREVLGRGWPYAVWDGPDTDWTGREAQQWRKERRAEGVVPLLAHQRQQIVDMGAAIRAHPTAALLLAAGEVMAELSAFWADDETGVWLRSRFDAVRLPGRVMIVDYKGLALDTALPTPGGWATMRDVQVGDRLLDSAGRPCSVTAKSAIHWRPCYRLRFDDGSTVICDDEHRWPVISGRPAGRRGHLGYRPAHVRTTEDIRRTLRLYGQRQHRVPVAEPFDLPRASLPVDPYVLGCWLGDGTTASGRITSDDPALFAAIAATGYTCGPAAQSDRCPTRTVYGLAEQLRHMGLIGHKAIPMVYLRSSRRQRVGLLQGLLDTDGSWNTTRQQVVFSNTDKALALAVRELACTLGQRATVHEATAHGFGLTVTVYQVTFTPRGIIPFRLPRKARQVAVRSTVRASRRVIVAVDEIPTVATQCVAVDSPDRTYLCTEAMIPTHNTAASADRGEFARAAGRFGYHMQDPWYREAVIHTLGDADPAFVFVVQSKTPPYPVAVYDLDLESQEAGHARNRRAIRTYAHCAATGVWGGHQDESMLVETVTVPRWAR